MSNEAAKKSTGAESPASNPELKAANAAVRSALVESRRDLLGFLHRRLGSQDEAEEVFGRFIVRALEHAPDLRDVRTVRGWLSRILTSTIIDYQRRSSVRRRREIAMDIADPDTLSIQPDAETDKAVCDCLYKVLPTLKPQYADVVWRVDLLGEPRERVAASLGTTVNNITVRLHRGRQVLKVRLEEMCITCPEHGFLDCHCDAARKSAESRARNKGRAPR